MKTRKRIREAELQDRCASFFRSHGFLAREEVPFLYKVADLFCFHEETGECIAIEVKVRNWREALTQALVYQMMADRVYVALCDEHLGPVDRELFTYKRVGLISVSTSGVVEIIIEAPESPRRIPHFVRRVVATAFPGMGSLACLML